MSAKQSFRSFHNILAGGEWRSHAVPTVSSYKRRETKKEQEALWHYASEGEYESIHRQSSVHPSVLARRLVHSVLVAVKLARVIHTETGNIGRPNHGRKKKEKYRNVVLTFEAISRQKILHRVE